MSFIDIIRNRKPLNLNRRKNSDLQRHTLEVHSQLIQAGRLLGGTVSNDRLKLPDGREYAFELNHYRVELIPLWTTRCHFLNPVVWHGGEPSDLKNRIIDHLSVITKIIRKTI